MDDDHSTEKTVRSDRSSTSNNSPHSNGHASPGAWARLKALITGVHDHSLRESLQGVIEQHGGENGIADIRPQERSMMLNLLEFAELRVDDVMVPRADIIAVEDNATIKSLLAIFIDANHSRVPIYHETLDDPLGMVHIKDLVRWITKRDKQANKANGNGHGNALAGASLSLSSKNLSTTISKSELIRDLLFVPPSMRAGDLLIKMQTSHIHMAVVVDEYGGTDGLASIEDLVEEIVGDIADEHDDADADLIKKEPAGTFSADARAPIDEVEILLNVDLLPDEREEDADTLGGLVFSMLGRVPVRGELIKHSSGIEFEVTGADSRRVKRLKIHPHGRTSKPIRTDDAAG